MKTRSLFFALPLIAVLALMAFNTPFHAEQEQTGSADTSAFPAEVKAILEVSCFDCHSAEASNFKAKSKLNFSNWDSLKTSKKIGKLEEICEEIKEGKMPVEKYVEKYPERKLTQKQISIICNWAEAETNRLMGE